MADLIDRQALMDAFRKHMRERLDRERCISEESCKACERGCLWRRIVAAAPTVDAVSRELLEQIKWERNIAMKQLEEHGIGFGAIAPDVVKVVRCRDCKHFWSHQDYDSPVCKQRHALVVVTEETFCSYGERREENAAD